VTVFDTARAYEGNERLLAAALRAGGVGERARIGPAGSGRPKTCGRRKKSRRYCEGAVAVRKR